ncbi:MAG: hypothetical protein DWQ05_15330 [Calditrichaeota bacterium]|nr:MAG: hypothetical protein DWQ05_15330 [Calditrichota bacterium]
MKEINLKVSLDEANLILEALGTLPFTRVFGLIGKIQEQAGHQLNGNSDKSEPRKKKSTVPELKG